MSRFKLGPKEVLAGTTLSVSTVGTESVCQQIDTVTYDITWANGSSLNAGITFEKYNGVDWVGLDIASAISLSGASGSETIIFLDINFLKIRPTVTFVAGSCDLSVVVNGSNKGA